ncbi:hypothetical protein LTR10_020061 [Elasticomyces elasticus]|uniref:AAA+ ATPase domain-containing protein n=1 Tax=Exophiala sideris TaxID=1016849 RepID=A0ABR0IVP4_9EURO|nr:hypothetical protein LTR10_020061 [Elasticomyces elasticus]KAK5021357.1 hypothetical protein LTS07_011100 [Exophiala sideris]KAK5024305.1 hypothetical protein LTR13_010926 [Exophiala sideris]KAK5049248.1 hypothetical protein LTR69_011123 [Exophiala sideris]KAK5176560.1 hypothetical protein LTR44_010948 [Eurotiomycetes sp. CCFEE 6388]
MCFRPLPDVVFSQSDNTLVDATNLNLPTDTVDRPWLDPDHATAPLENSGTDPTYPTLPPISVTSESDSSVQYPVIEEHRPRVDILYGLCFTQEKEKDVTVYCDQPFSGIQYGTTFSSMATDKPEQSILTLQILAGPVKASLEGHTLENWWKPAHRLSPEVTKHIPMRWLQGLSLTINSKSLLAIMESIIDYNPSQLSLGCGHYVADDSNCFPGLLLYYDELKICYLSYLASDLSAREDPERIQSLPIPPAELGDTSSVLWGPSFGRTEPAAQIKDYDTAYEVGLLLKTLTPSYQHKIMPIMQGLGEMSPQVDFEHLWRIYKPGTVVYKKRHDTFSAYIVVSATLCSADQSSRAQKSRVDRYAVEIWNIAYDGRFLRRRPSIVQVERFHGPRLLDSLPLIPAICYDRLDGGAARRSIEKRGEKYYSLIEQGCAHRMFKHAESAYEGQVILDPMAFEKHITEEDRLCQYPEDNDQDEGHLISSKGKVRNQPHDNCGYRRFQNYDGLDTKDQWSQDSISSSHLLLMSPFINGLALSTKRWMRFQVEGISEQSPYQLKDLLQEVLVLPNKEDREALQIVKPKAKETPSLQPDFLPGKGESQIFLLYGPPGTGKTFTAECVANDTGRPLISLAPSDLGHHMVTEDLLRQWFTLAAKWGAILLIDEADIFLEKRGKDNITRTYLATAFLRALEYYAGVLFLVRHTTITTNRPGQIDDAFASRISVPICYPALSKESQMEIWDRFCDQYETTDAISISYDARELLLHEPVEMNGREIRTVFQNAIALAELDAEKKTARLQRKKSLSVMEGTVIKRDGLIRVTEDHFKKALKRRRDFKKYLDSINNQRIEHGCNKVAGNYAAEVDLM